jgi:hypothetical protein
MVHFVPFQQRLLLLPVEKHQELVILLHLMEMGSRLVTAPRAFVLQ